MELMLRLGGGNFCSFPLLVLVSVPHATYHRISKGLLALKDNFAGSSGSCSKKGGSKTHFFKLVAFKVAYDPTHKYVYESY